MPTLVPKYTYLPHTPLCCPVCGSPVLDFYGIDTYCGDEQSGESFAYRFGKPDEVIAAHLPSEAAALPPPGRTVFIAVRCESGHDFRFYVTQTDAVLRFAAVAETADFSPPPGD